MLLLPPGPRAPAPDTSPTTGYRRDPASRVKPESGDTSVRLLLSRIVDNPVRLVKPESGDTSARLLSLSPRFSSRVKPESGDTSARLLP